METIIQEKFFLNDLSIALIIPTLNAEHDIPRLFSSIMQQSLKPQHILVIDSSSTDKTRELLAHYPVTIHTIPGNQFDHSGTRRLAMELIDADIYLFMTQDVIPVDCEAFKNLVTSLLSRDDIGCAYGRQVAKDTANPLSVHGRLFNYPKISQLRYMSDRHKYGIKTCFNSNSFSAYRKHILKAIGSFPDKLLVSEDCYVAAKMLLQGYAVYYNADAVVMHSHNMSLPQRFHRYFSIGVVYGNESWIIKTFKAPTSEGMRYTFSEIIFLLKNRHTAWIPYSILSSLVSYVAYQAGLYEKYIPNFIKKRLGTNVQYW